MRGIYFRFESAGSANVVEEGEGRTPRYYLDNLWLIKKATKSATDFEVPLRENEIADFESLWQGYMFTNDNPGLTEVVEAEDFGLTAPSGSKVLHAVFTGTGAGASNWIQMNISSKLLNKTVLFGMDADTARNATSVSRRTTTPILGQSDVCLPHAHEPAACDQQQLRAARVDEL